MQIYHKFYLEDASLAWIIVHGAEHKAVVFCICGGSSKHGQGILGSLVCQWRKCMYHKFR